MHIDLGIDHAFLREWTPGDAEALARYANNRSIWKNLRDAFPHPYRVSDAEEFLARNAGRQPAAVLAIALPGEAIGSIGLSPGADVHRFSAEMGYWLAEPFWGRGLVTEAVRKFTSYAFETFGLCRLFAEPFGDNTASARVLEKAGFTLEGRLRMNAFKDGRMQDQLLYAMVKDGTNPPAP